MSKRFTYARSMMTVEGHEVFTAVEFDSFDEAITAVEKGIRDRAAALKEKYPGGTVGQNAVRQAIMDAAEKNPLPTSPNMNPASGAIKSEGDGNPSAGSDPVPNTPRGI